MEMCPVKVIFMMQFKFKYAFAKSKAILDLRLSLPTLNFRAGYQYSIATFKGAT